MSMTPKDFAELCRGDVVRNDATGHSYVIMQGTTNNYFVAARVIHVTKPDQWTRIAKSVYVPRRVT